VEIRESSATTASCGCIGPVVTQNIDLWLSTPAFLASVIMHAMALNMGHSRQDSGIIADRG
jgi:hypothetical protein